MKIIRPTQITDDRMMSSTVPEDVNPPYSAVVTYATGALVIWAHRLYESLQNNNIGNDPLAQDGWWLAKGATNRWAAFDAKVGAQTVQADSINYVLSPGMIDSAALLNLDATSVTLVMTDPIEGEVYNETIPLLSSSNVFDAYSYCFDPILQRTECVALYLPPYGAAVLSITITNSGGDAKCGEIVVGMQAELGGTEYGASLGIVDYSRKEKDQFGEYEIIERDYSKRLSCNLIIDTAQVDAVAVMLAKYRAKPVVWIGAQGFDALIIYGYYRSFDLLIQYLTQSACSLEIEGLT